MYNKNYLKILLFIFIGITIGIIPQIIGYICGPHKSYKEKNSSYECGFNSFKDSRIKFNIKYYLIAIFFILFDIESIFFFPWCISMKKIGIYGYITIMIFIFELIIAFLYILKEGALEW
ncbi:NADH-quinone oxidoreductase subunit A [Candidatus Zinderia endosymbiont of Aphrophora alni]|uniref:NADH-quinone oxidoreductase subunit A n=1 Tax=Candidatus Zinderia endosymbiont of Aphrophora alni TaxID=3077951 RepID=UPI0030CD5C15